MMWIAQNRIELRLECAYQVRRQIVRFFGTGSGANTGAFEDPIRTHFPNLSIIRDRTRAFRKISRWERIYLPSFAEE